MSVFSTGILVLTTPLHTLPLRIAPVLSSAAQVVERILYVHLHPGLNLGSVSQARPAYIPAVADVSSLITRLYSNAADVCGHLDVRVLLTNIRAQQCLLGPGGASSPFPSPQTLSHSPEVVLTDFALQDPGQSPVVAKCLQKYAGHCYTCSPGLASVLLHSQLEPLVNEVEQEGGEMAQAEALQTYSDLVDLLKNKVLKELIEPYSLRVRRLREFLQDIKPSLQYEIVPLSDPFGPSVTDPQLQCIVVSEETRKGGDAVNKKRQENGLPTLVLHEIQLLKDAHHSEIEEEKISSSSLRCRLLGTVLNSPEDKPHLPPNPYIIGLTGGSGSGKSSIAGRLEALGAVRIDSDQLGHETYCPGTAAYQKVVMEFGTDILNEDKTINRRCLGRKVFGNTARLKALTDIVWPEIALLVKQKIQQARVEGKQVCVVDAAVLLEAGWTDMVHEVWVAMIPEEEAVSRITARDRVSVEDARRRLQSQWPTVQQVAHANVVLCTLWEPDITQKQVQKAWDLLQERLNQRGKVHPTPPLL
uniref:Bifunctional coenzyme A synthase n=1 Tax=Paramormyrops kingsleyae TaxID=1676925 RepID=A0A3B3R3A1_9TELE